MTKIRIDDQKPCTSSTF